MEMYVSFSDFLRFFRKKRAAFLIVVLAFGLICGIAPLKLAKYTYSASTTILFNSDIPESEDINSNLQLPGILNNRIQTAVAEASSNDLVEKTAAELGIDKEQIGKITGEQVKSSLAVKLTVQTADADMAAKISDTAAQLLGGDIQEQFPSPKLKVTVVEKADESKVQGKKSAMAKAGLLGLVLGFIVFVCYGMIRVLCDHTVRAGAAAEETLRTKFLGDVPGDRRGSAHKDAFRRIRSVFLHSAGPAKSILVTGVSESACGAETAAGLSASFAQAGRKVLLVDADLRRPALADRFAVNPEKTLFHVLSGSCSAAQAAVEVPVQPGLYLLASSPCKKADPADLFARNFGKFLSEAEADYDAVVVSAPAELACPDAESIAPSAQAVVVAAKYGSTTYNALRIALRGIKESGGRIAGFVIAGI